MGRCGLESDSADHPGQGDCLTDRLPMPTLHLITRHKGTDTLLGSCTMAKVAGILGTGMGCICVRLRMM